jgi:hypothetical protein
VDKHVHERVGDAFHARENEAFREDGENMSIESAFRIKGLCVEHVGRTGPHSKIAGKTGARCGCAQSRWIGLDSRSLSGIAGRLRGIPVRTIHTACG